MVKNSVPAYRSHEERQFKLQQKYIYIQKIIASASGTGNKKKLQVKE